MKIHRCDNCEKDITNTDNCDGWKISVKQEKLPRKPNVPIKLLGVWPPLDGDYEFCGIKCLKSWVAKSL